MAWRAASGPEGGGAHGPLVLEAAGSHGVRELLAPLGETLAAYGGNAGILRDQAPPPLDGWTGIDAVVVSADNELTQ